MPLLIRRKPRPTEVRMGEVVFVVRPVTLALRNEVRARVRAAGKGLVDQEVAERELSKAMLGGWRGLKDVDTGEEIPFGPCPACQINGSATGGVPEAEAPTLLETPPRPACAACGGSGDCRDWAVRTWPDALWTPIWEAGNRFLAEEVKQSGN